MSQLRTVDPAGRVDVLAYRLGERLAQRVCPQEWPIFAPHVAGWAERALGPSRLGGVTDTIFSWIDRYTYKLPVNPSPASQPPKAPITTEKMRTWSPADLAEAEAQRAAQYVLDTIYFRGNAGNRKTEWPTLPDPPPAEPTDKTLLWVALGIGAAGVVGLLLSTRR